MSIVTKLKENSEDFEWYPTTQEIVDAVSEKMESVTRYHMELRILDVGCGKGDFFEKLKADRFRLSKFGIEKAQLLYTALPEDVTLLGTDFHEQSLLDKKMDIIFCNPPYSEFDEWAVKIITEANTDHLFLVIPTRWAESKTIKEVLKSRSLEAQILGTFTFENAERRARAVTNLVYVHFEREDDAFSLWFDKTFDGFKETQHIKDSTYTGKDITTGTVTESVPVLLEEYRYACEKLVANYKAVEALDKGILQELGVCRASVMKAIKEKAAGLKNTYWARLFSVYEPVMNRLTTKTREKVRAKLTSNMRVDFTEGNILAITLWIVQNANKYYDEQVKQLFLDLADSDSIRQYKTMYHFDESAWRYLKEGYRNRWDFREKLHHVQLDYRIIVSCGLCFTGYSEQHLTDTVADKINDIKTVAGNLGFDLDMPWLLYYNEKASDWASRSLYLKDGREFCTIKLHKNGNMHIKFMQEFMRVLNVEAARLFGWIINKEEAEKEFGNGGWCVNKQHKVSDILLLEA